MAIFQSYAIPAASYTYRTLLYRALVDVPGSYAAGDIIVRTEQINEATGLATGVETWRNDTQGIALGAAPTVGAQVEALDGLRLKLASETLTVSSTAVALAAIPAEANHAEVHVWDADVSLRLDGSAPTSTVGIRQANGQTFELEGRQELINFQAIRLAATDARLYVEYSRVYGSNDHND